MSKYCIDDGCILCRLLFDQELQSEPANEFLYNGEHHYVVSGLGAFVPGYALLVSKVHVHNFASLPAEALEEFCALRKKMRAILEQTCGEWTIFEHGEIAGFKAGGCVTHAHLHFLGKKVQLAEALEAQFVHRSATLGEARGWMNPENAYLYVEEQDGPTRFYFVDTELPRQFLRREIARRLQLADFWDYRLYPFDANIEKTIDMFRGQL